MAPKLRRVVRLDSVPLSKAYYTEEGYLMDRPILTSTGIFEYTNPDGSIRRELRLPEEVFSPESLRSYKGKPIIITHGAGLVNKDNVHDESVGTILSEGYKDGNSVRAEIVIHDTDEMKKAGLKELSLGYNLDLDETPGIWNGQPYDAVQRNIIINHLALVLEARAGDQARLNVDSRDKISKGAKKMNNYRRRIRRDGVLSPEDLSKAIAEYKARRAERMAAKQDEDQPVMPQKKPVAAVDEDDPIIAPAGKKPVATPSVAQDTDNPEEQVQLVKDRRDRRDEQGDPATKQEALGVIAQQDGDMDILFDIIDTLLAERDFAQDDCNRDGDEDPDALIGDEDDEFVEDQDEFAAPMKKDSDPLTKPGTGKPGMKKDSDPSNPFAKKNGMKKDSTPFAPMGKKKPGQQDADEPLDPRALGTKKDAEIMGKGAGKRNGFGQDADLEDETMMDGFEEDPEANIDGEDDAIPSTAKKDVGKSVLNVDSVDNVVRQRIKLGMIGRMLNMDGLEDVGIWTGKRAVIRAVNPSVRLDGKSKAYINAAFDCACDQVMRRSRKDTSYQMRQMFNQDSRNSYVDDDSSTAARQRMIYKQMNKKEDK